MYWKRVIFLFDQEDVSWPGELALLSITILITASVSVSVGLGCGVYYQKTRSTPTAHPPAAATSQEADVIPLQTSILPHDVKAEVQDDELAEVICVA